MHNAAPIPEPTPAQVEVAPRHTLSLDSGDHICPLGDDFAVGNNRLSSADDLRRELSIQQRGRDIQRHRELSRAASDLGVMWEEMALMNVAKREMYALIAQRSPEQIARMQAWQEERMAREPGAEKQ